MSSVVEHSRFSAFDDLHIDQVVPAYADRAAWADGSVALLLEAGRIRDRSGWPGTVAIGISLTSGESPAGFDGLRILDDVVAAADWTPPSLYLFERGDEPWRDDSYCLATARFRDEGHGVEVCCCEWHHRLDNEFRRTCWLTTSPNPAEAG